ncbi:hypothetical protein [Roseivivax isoporae]|uniref:Uncharacterized protein n=1 Tax=Roseivivax isoporae LMG 25204 TaxID=1449351 RepID=X7F994_9RHOB|nr:hypothetical protein [Roseivivax isoporae]ETX28671.1 hypothetical protein RISW2_05075 [Roseivivax isoporae LMG 25204]
MKFRMLGMLAALVVAALPARADRAAYLDLARKGWVYELRTTMVGRDMTIPVRIHGRSLAGAALCIVGEAPHPGAQEVLDAFADLMRTVHGKPLPMRYAGSSARRCGTGRTVVLRLYSGRPPNLALTDDLAWMNKTLALGLPPGRSYMATSPAMAQTFFGRRGAGTHLMVKQPGPGRLTDLERAFYRSILIEELFQSFTFGMDILHFDSDAPYLSKLEEFPVNLMNLPWDSAAFMEGLLGSNPTGLCEFDILMLHAVATAPMERTNDAAFLDYVDDHYDAFLQQARSTLADLRFDAITDPDCRGPVGD